MTAAAVEGEVTLGRELRAITTAPAGLPSLTLGWQILGWTADYLLQPDGPKARQPLDLTDEQAHHLLWWYSVEPDGSWTYVSGMLRRMKGWGKDPYGAVLCAVEMLGPCRLLGWTKDGQPIGGPDQAAWVQTVAVSQDQTRNTMTLFPGLFGKRPRYEKQGRAIVDYDLDIGKTIIYGMGGTRRIEAVTSSPTSVEGGRSTFVLKNETQNWFKSNDGLAMSGVIAGNVAKITAGAGRALAIANAHVPGRGSDAEMDHKKYLDIEAGRSLASRFLYDSREAPKVDLQIHGTGEEGAILPADIQRRDDDVRAGLRAARGESTWLDVERLLVELNDPKTPPSEFRRKYLNQVNAAEDSWVAPVEYNACKRRRELIPGELITIGLDGSRSVAHTVMVGCCISDAHIFPLGIWDPAKFAGHEVPRLQIDGAFRKAFTDFDVVGAYSDVHPFESYIDTWHADFRETLCVHATDRNYVGWDMRRGVQMVTKAVEALYEAIRAEQVSFGDDGKLDQYFYNAVRIQNSWGITFGKESDGSSNEVDGADASVLAYKARSDYLALPPEKRRQPKAPKPKFFTFGGGANETS